MEKIVKNRWVIQNQSLLLYCFIIFFSLPFLQLAWKYWQKVRMRRLLGCFNPLQSLLNHTVGICTQREHQRLLRSTCWLWNGTRRKRKQRLEEYFVTLQTWLCDKGPANTTPKPKVLVQLFPKFLLKQSTWAGCGEVTWKVRIKSTEEFKPNDDDHPVQS